MFSEHQQRRGGPPIWIFAIVAGVFIGLMLNLILWLAPAAKRPSSYHQDPRVTNGALVGYEQRDGCRSLRFCQPRGHHGRSATCARLFAAARVARPKCAANRVACCDA